jgi:hypothetical protein
VPAQSIRKQIKPDEFEDLSERLIVIPSDVDREFGTRFAMGVMQASKKLNRVVLVPSKRESERWQESGATPVLANNISAALKKLGTSQGEFLALIAKYDGIDLPDDLCRLLVLDSLPRAASSYDWYLQSVLLDSPTNNARIAQKIEQGLGRATRGKSDYCAILITGDELVAFVQNKSNRAHLSVGTNAQLELGLAITREIHDSVSTTEYSQALVYEINRCIQRSDEWKVFYRSFIEGCRQRPRPQTGNTDALEIAEIEHKAADLFLTKNYREAASEARSISVRSGLTSREVGWFLQLSAAYLYPADKSRALSTQLKAYETNNFLFIPPEGITYHRMAEQADTQVTRAFGAITRFESRNEFVVNANALCDRLEFGIDSNTFEQALTDLAQMIGIPASRPEKETGRGPDCLWQGASGHYYVIEAKSKVELERKVIHKSECEQLLHSCEWFRQEYPGKEYHALLIHPSSVSDRVAVFPEEGKVVTVPVLGKFTLAVRNYVRSLGNLTSGPLTTTQVHDSLNLNRILFEQCFSDAQKVYPQKS